MHPKPGDKVKVVTKDETVEGVLLPNEETDAIVVKLSSGYNVGIDRKKVKSMAVLESPKAKEEKKGAPPAAQKGLPTIAILHTGGTIASKVDYRTGGVVARFSPEEILGMFPELGKIANIRSRLISNMFSEDMRFAHYSIMAKAIAEELAKGADGVIVTHGTDTMAYSSAALAFALEGLAAPVIMVGSQRSSDRGSSDAVMNLLCAASFIAKTDFAGVAICMHADMGDEWCSILPATKTRKLHTSRRDAFRPVNAKPIAKVSYKTREVTLITKDHAKRGKGKLVLKDKFEEKVGLLKCHPNMTQEQFEFFKEHKYKGLVIEGTGLGQAPVGVPNELAKPNEKNLKAIEALCKSGCVVVMTSQCLFGRVQMHVYSDAIDLTKAGVVPGEDMLPEVAFIKLAWLLGNYKADEAKKLISQNLRGEINSRLGREFELPEG